MMTDDRFYQLLAKFLVSEWDRRYQPTGRMLTPEELDRNFKARVAARRAARQEVK